MQGIYLHNMDMNMHAYLWSILRGSM